MFIPIYGTLEDGRTVLVDYITDEKFGKPDYEIFISDTENEYMEPVFKTDFDERIITPVIVKNEAERTSICLMALWDTGATTSCIDISKIEKMKLKLSDSKYKISRAGGIDYVKTTKCHFKMPDNSWLEITPTVMDNNVELNPFDFVVGMDIIKHGNFTIKKNEDSCYFEFTV